MGSGMDDKRKGLEEEYFHRKNQEAIEKLRAQMKVAIEAKTTGLSSMECPRCDGSLKENKIDEVSIDTNKEGEDRMVRQTLGCGELSFA